MPQVPIGKPKQVGDELTRVDESRPTEARERCCGLTTALSRAMPPIAQQPVLAFGKRPVQSGSYKALDEADQQQACADGVPTSRGEDSQQPVPLCQRTMKRSGRWKHAPRKATASTPLIPRDAARGVPRPAETDPARPSPSVASPLACVPRVVQHFSAVKVGGALLPSKRIASQGMPGTHIGGPPVLNVGR